MRNHLTASGGGGVVPGPGDPDGRGPAPANGGRERARFARVRAGPAGVAGPVVVPRSHR